MLIIRSASEPGSRPPIPGQLNLPAASGQVVKRCGRQQWRQPNGGVRPSRGCLLPEVLFALDSAFADSRAGLGELAAACAPAFATPGICCSVVRPWAVRLEAAKGEMRMLLPMRCSPVGSVSAGHRTSSATWSRTAFSTPSSARPALTPGGGLAETWPADRSDGRDAERRGVSRRQCGRTSGRSKLALPPTCDSTLGRARHTAAADLRHRPDTPRRRPGSASTAKSAPDRQRSAWTGPAASLPAPGASLMFGFTRRASAQADHRHIPHSARPSRA